MTTVKYVPVDYLTYNLSAYVNSILIIIMYLLFYIILYWILRYELLNIQNICDPGYYYGKACGNMISKNILLDPTFLEEKRKFYRTRDSIIYDEIPEDNKNMTNSEKKINKKLKNNDEFVNSNIGKIQQFSDNLNSVFQKYLGNIQSFVNDTKDVSQETMQSFSQISSYLDDLKNQINESIINPAFAKYTDPLKKLYKSLQATYDSSVPFASLSNFAASKNQPTPTP